MTLPPASSDRTLSIFLSLAQYPILSSQIRARMRRELFSRGIIKSQAFEAEAREKAIRSQALEGLHDPFSEEPADIWELRLTRIRDHLTDFYFAYNLPYDLFEEIVRDALAERGAGIDDFQVSFNPELAPQNMLFEQAMSIEKMLPEQRSQHEARLQEIKVVLIRTMISDQLAYVKIAKDWFKISDLNEIRTHKIGQGKIGGKAAGMLLAARILYEVGDEEIHASLQLPTSYFLGADLTYTFMALNSLMHWGDQKYKLEEQIRADYPKIQQEFMSGDFPPDILEKFRALLDQVGHQPIIVRSSSLLEDNFGTSFAGKYESHFCPNQGTPEQNMRDFTRAIIRIYASIFNPDALLYRRAKGLLDYDERMAVLIQTVQGDRSGRYYFPHAAGVAFSRNLYRWSPQIRRDDGFIRLVWGLGTRAVDRVGNDYPRLVALSHPLLHPEVSPKDIRRYSQQFIDLIDLEANEFKTLPVEDVLDTRNPISRYIAQVFQGGYLSPLRMAFSGENKGNLVLTFDELLKRTSVARCFISMLNILEETYQSPVDTEFTLEITGANSTQPKVRISLLQCRPQSHLKESEARLPKNLLDEEIIFSTYRMAPEGRISGIRFMVFVSPEAYYKMPTAGERAELGRSIGKLNAVLKNETFICVGPGRWGTSNPDLGVKIGYADIYHTRALIELTGEGIGSAPEASFGTHFFQDLVESNIYPLAIYLDDDDVIFNRPFFYETPNCLLDYLPEEKAMVDVLRLIKVSSYQPGMHMELIMDDESGRSVAFLERD
ncbi:MAG TPA: PEP/pyruvate-binding domain-containing protein [Anaerolineales bacterium]|nr:PEP/pyruvate-binding domain-containing protein [Anaerolineales bacterium]